MSAGLQRNDPSAQISAVAVATPIDTFVDVPQMPRWAGRVIYLLIGLIVVFGIWSVLAKVDIVVEAEGKLVAPGEQINMQVYETAFVKSVDVHVGQQVKKGERLATLDPTFTAADLDDLVKQTTALGAAKTRMKAEIDDTSYAPDHPDASQSAQLQIYHQRQAERQSHIASLEKKTADLNTQLAFAQSNEGLLRDQLDLARQMVQMDEQLSTKGLSLLRQVIDAKSKQIDALSKLTENQQNQERLAAQIAAAEADKDAYSSEWNRKLAEDYDKTSNDLDTAMDKLAKAKRRSDLIAMTSPVDGSVLDIPKRNIGSVLREGETLLTLVPGDKIMPVDAAVASKDIAYLHVGQPVQIKFEALPYQEHGSASGTLVSVTPDTTRDNAVSDEQNAGDNSANDSGHRYYRVGINIDRTDLRNLPDDFQLRPGMRAQADIKVGLRTVASYLLHPLTRTLDEGLRER